MNKDFNASFDDEKQEISQSDMALINTYSQKELKSEDVYVFSVVLCDNEIDRDFERFTVSALNTLSKLFVGKTAIKNHSNNSEDQSARTFRTEVITDAEKLNSLGEPYVYLKAHCYMPKIKKNEALIAEIQSGIKKEVSIGCAVSKSICSICKTDSRSGACSHKKGRKYKGELCYSELEDPTDAYEWSFVAVPAQKNAGVTKSFSENGVKDMESIIKSITEADGEIVVSQKDASVVSAYIKELEEKAKTGEEYRKSLEDETVKLFAFTVKSLSNDYSESICRSLSTEDLKQLKSALESERKTAAQSNAPQLFRDKQKENNNNQEFRF